MYFLHLNPRKIIVWLEREKEGKREGSFDETCLPSSTGKESEFLVCGWCLW
jgi:hypothetical protein